jgi:hypothetical protein
MSTPPNIVSDGQHLQLPLDLKEVAPSISEASSDGKSELDLVSWKQGSNGPHGDTNKTIQVTWDSPDDLENPKNWSQPKKWTVNQTPTTLRNLKY